MISTDYSLPVTENCVFALRLDMKKKTEEILIGELKNVKQRLDGIRDASMLYETKRDIGRLVMDYVPIPIEIEDIRAALVGNTGKNKSIFFFSQTNAIAEYADSDNPIHRFTALLMWQEYNKALSDKKAAESLHDTIDDITLAVRFGLIDYVTRWQERNRKNPLEYLDREYRKYPILVYYSGGMNTNEYAMADRSLLPIAVYYLKRVYDSGRFIQTCPVCGKSFVAKTAGMTTLCSDGCRRVQGKESKRRFDERARDVSYERAYKNTYMYWYNKVKKCRGMNLPTDKMEKIEKAFSFFGQASAARKKEVGKEKDKAAEYESWLLMQRNVIDDLLKSLGL
jgi:hypothetical protein